MCANTLNGTLIWPIGIHPLAVFEVLISKLITERAKKAKQHLCFDWSKVEWHLVWVKMAAVLSVIICCVLALSFFPASPLLNTRVQSRRLFLLRFHVFWHHFLPSFLPVHLLFSSVNCFFFGCSSHTHDFCSASHCASICLLTTIAPLSKHFYFLVPQNSTLPQLRSHLHIRCAKLIMSSII